MSKADRSSTPQRDGDTAYRPLYVSMAEHSDDGVDLADLIGRLWAGRVWVIGVTLVFALASVAYALLAEPIFRAEVVVAPVTDEQLGSAGGQLGGLASLAGLNLAGGKDSAEAIATLQSRKFAEDFIRERELLPLLFADLWDPSSGSWKVPADQQPDLRDGVAVFLKNVRSVSEPDRNGLITLAINWRDAQQAADWAADMIQRINERMRTRDMEESEQKLKYLTEQLSAATPVELREAIARIIEEQLSALTLAKARREYAFRVIDPPMVPKQRSWPQRSLIVLAGTSIGSVLGVMLALIQVRVRGARDGAVRSPR